MTRNGRVPGRRGYTLVETSLVVVVLSLFLGATARLVTGGSKAYEQGASVSALDSRARRAIERAASELSTSVRGSWSVTALAPLGTETLQFRPCEGSNAGTIVTGNARRLELRRDPADANNGVDDDGDGLVDEGLLVLVRDVGLSTETEAVLVRGVTEYAPGETPNAADDNGNGLVDERGFSIVSDANGTATIRLTIAGLDPDRRLVTRTVETRVYARN